VCVCVWRYSYCLGFISSTYSTPSLCVLQEAVVVAGLGLTLAMRDYVFYPEPFYKAVDILAPAYSNTTSADYENITGLKTMTSQHGSADIAAAEVS
jgi:hypothetical protein